MDRHTSNAGVRIENKCLPGRSCIPVPQSPVPQSLAPARSERRYLRAERSACAPPGAPPSLEFDWREAVTGKDRAPFVLIEGGYDDPLDLPVERFAIQDSTGDSGAATATPNKRMIML